MMFLHKNDAREFFTELLTLILEEKIMADTTRVKAEIAEINAKLDVLIAKPAPEPVPQVDEQPEIDAIADQLAAISAKIPA